MTGTHSALLVVDVQNDFCPGGALAVATGDRVIGPINAYVERAVRLGITVYLTRDWHPRQTRHFKAYGGMWPPHCVQGSVGARFHHDLRVPAGAILVSKGDDPDRDAYSAFDGHTDAGSSLLSDMRARGITHVYMAGLATDYCIRYSVHDALRAGLHVTVLIDAVAGIDLVPGDIQRALDEIKASGGHLAAGPEALSEAEMGSD